MNQTPYLSRVEPQKTLCALDPAKRLSYTPAVKTQTEGILARWVKEKQS